MPGPTVGQLGEHSAGADVSAGDERGLDELRGQARRDRRVRRRSAAQ